RRTALTAPALSALAVALLAQLPPGPARDPLTQSMAGRPVAPLVTPTLVSDNSFPTSTSGPALVRWLSTHSTLRPGQIVAAGGGRLIAVVRKVPGPAAGLVRITIRTEIITREAAAAAGARSETGDLDVDCDGRRALSGETLQYALPNLTGTLKIKSGSDAWM